MVEWLGRRPRNPEFPGSSPTLNLSSKELFLSSPEFNSSAALVNSHLVCLLPVGILNHVMFNLNYFLCEF